MQNWRALFGLIVFVLATPLSATSAPLPMPEDHAEMVDCHETKPPTTPPSHDDSDCQNACHCPVSQTIWLMQFAEPDALAVVYDPTGAKCPVADLRRDFDLNDRLKRPPRV